MQQSTSLILSSPTPSPQGSQQPEDVTPVSRPRKLESVSKDWTENFMKRQRSPARAVARRSKAPEAKKPLTLPKLSGRKKFKPRNPYTDFKTRPPGKQVEVAGLIGKASENGGAGMCGLGNVMKDRLDILPSQRKWHVCWARRQAIKRAK